MNSTPSISKDLLLKSLSHAKNFIDITKEQIEIILTCRKFILTDNNSTWIKNCTDNFNLPMCAYDFTEIIDLVGIYILDTLGRMIDLKLVSLYWDDCLIFIPDSNGPKILKIHKKIISAFKLLGFKIEISSNLKIVNFSNIIFNLSNNTFKPFNKHNHTSTYINVQPPQINKHIPKAVNIRINRLSSNKKIFDENNRINNEALEKSGFQQRLEYQEQVINNKVTEHGNIDNSSGTINNNNSNDYWYYRLEDSDNNINSNNKKLSIGKER